MATEYMKRFLGQLGWRQVAMASVMIGVALLGAGDALFGTGVIAQASMLILLLLGALVGLAIIHRTSHVNVALGKIARQIELNDGKQRESISVLKTRIAEQIELKDNEQRQSINVLKEQIAEQIEIKGSEHRASISALRKHVGKSVDGLRDALQHAENASETANRRLMDSFAAETSALLKDHRTLEARLLRVNDSVDKLSHSLRWRNEQLVIEVQSLLTLFSALDVRELLPNSTAWSMSPSLITTFLTALGSLDRPLILECGSGNTTLFIAHALRMRGGGKLVALEHLPEWGDKIRSALEREGLSDYAQVRCAPLEEVDLMIDVDPDSRQSSAFSWYAHATYADLEKVDAILVDGPPGSTNRWARYPALPQLLDRLAERVIVLLDDTQRAEEREILDLWEKFLQRTDYRIENLEKLRGATLFQLRKLTASVPPAYSPEL